MRTHSYDLGFTVLVERVLGYIDYSMSLLEYHILHAKNIKFWMPHLSVAFALKDDPLHPLFPQSMVCQPWKLQWLGGNLQSSSERAMDNFKKYVPNQIFSSYNCCRLGESGSIHVDTRGLLNAFKDVVNLRLHLGETKGVIPPQHGSNVDKVIVATNKVCTSQFTPSLYLVHATPGSIAIYI